eukprot:6210860-Amphidinium_carterae.2
MSQQRAQGDAEPPELRIGLSMALRWIFVPGPTQRNTAAWKVSRGGPASHLVSIPVAPLPSCLLCQAVCGCPTDVGRNKLLGLAVLAART